MVQLLALVLASVVGCEHLLSWAQGRPARFVLGQGGQSVPAQFLGQADLAELCWCVRELDRVDLAVQHLDSSNDLACLRAIGIRLPAA